jgi:hypothetical protein
MRIIVLIVVGIMVSRGLSIGDALADTTVSWDGLGSCVNAAGQTMYPDLCCGYDISKLFSDAESRIAETLVVSCSIA